MKGWFLGCWFPLQDWPNTRWTSGWPETCSWRRMSGSHTDLSEREFPLYLNEMVHEVSTQLGVETFLSAVHVLREATYPGGATVCRPAGPPDSVCVTVQEKSGRGSCLQTAAPDFGNSSCRQEDWGSIKCIPIVDKDRKRICSIFEI